MWTLFKNKLKKKTWNNIWCNSIRIFRNDKLDAIRLDIKVRKTIEIDGIFESIGWPDTKFIVNTVDIDERRIYCK